MATFAFTDAFISINGVDLSDHGTQLTVEIAAELLDNTAFGHTARTSGPGLKTGSMQSEFLQDYAAGSVDATCFTTVALAAYPVIWRPLSSAKSATNPEFTANHVTENYQPVGQSVGDQAKATLSTANASSAGWARGV